MKVIANTLPVTVQSVDITGLTPDEFSYIVTALGQGIGSKVGLYSLYSQLSTEADALGLKHGFHSPFHKAFKS